MKCDNRGCWMFNQTFKNHCEAYTEVSGARCPHRRAFHRAIKAAEKRERVRLLQKLIDGCRGIGDSWLDVFDLKDMLKKEGKCTHTK